MNQDEKFMWAALEQAKLADQHNEVPVGAVVVLDGVIIGKGYNQPISANDPTAHAEVVALRDAAKNVKNYRLVEADLYVTVEPCAMCSGAMIHGRIRRVVYGTTEPKAGMAESQGNLFAQSYFNHKVDVVGGVLAQECTDVIQAFFKRRRKEKSSQKQ